MFDLCELSMNRLFKHVGTPPRSPEIATIRSAPIRWDYMRERKRVLSLAVSHSNTITRISIFAPPNRNTEYEIHDWFTSPIMLLTRFLLLPLLCSLQGRTGLWVPPPFRVQLRSVKVDRAGFGSRHHPCRAWIGPNH